jgi:AcrR family transcriptional regulator
MITEKAGVDNRSFYYLFESKEDILATVVENLADKALLEYDSIAAGPADPVEKLSEIIEKLISFRQGRELITGLIKKQSVNVKYMFAESLMEKAGPLMEGVITEGVKRGMMRAYQPAQTARLVLNNMIFLFSSVAETEREERKKLIGAFFFMTEASLGLEEGTLREMHLSKVKYAAN